VSTETNQRTPTRQNEPEQIEAAELRPILPDQGPIALLEGDVSDAFLASARKQGLVAWDIETSGLDWRSERIGLCQLLVKNEELAIVKINNRKRPRNLAALLRNSRIQKVFHHAMFDLRFMCYHWGVPAANIACTKIASKLLNPSQSHGHSLANLVQHYFGKTIDKSSRKSDWLTWALTQKQLAYAGDDVVYLFDLLEKLMAELESRKLTSLAERCFGHIPTQVELEIRGYKDIYSY
jgi:ribonuclease D